MGMRTSAANLSETGGAEAAVDTVCVPRRHGPPKRKIARLIGDKGYESRPLHARFLERGTDLITPHRRNTRRRWADGRKLRRYKRRWRIERTFSWLHSFKRIWTRSDRYLSVFHGWLHVALILICLRRL
jgi:transposase